MQFGAVCSACRALCQLVWCLQSGLLWWWWIAVVVVVVVVVAAAVEVVVVSVPCSFPGAVE